jgi:hypothetical protein
MLADASQHFVLALHSSAFGGFASCSLGACLTAGEPPKAQLVAEPPKPAKIFFLFFDCPP